ncbi:MAG: MmcQ/YjbR family DNA-binding protein [Bacteroidota bacterium]|nr:MmcQ/YjbR family DNA-binding protein [Bacteroidota bacterium]MDP4234102.1 MmcQ/YjbR family DNA-binding protein [Bacteroidota bacterium]MDP4243043.1 MmcQ/YjbR family DNA-binding protein [Bacteroidota bacterium]MDP4287469.1 MmcQ/YjbR family DNA-binding protein [Bacteroidota bacterium]
MDLDEVRSYCLAKEGVQETFPFGDTHHVFKVGGKMFLLASSDSIPLTINVKADPVTAIEQRERYAAVTPGYHMNKKHWNTVILNGSIRPTLLKQWIDDSYNLVLASIPKAKRPDLA